MIADYSVHLSAPCSSRCVYGYVHLVVCSLLYACLALTLSVVLLVPASTVPGRFSPCPALRAPHVGSFLIDCQLPCLPQSPNNHADRLPCLHMSLVSQLHQSSTRQRFHFQGLPIPPTSTAAQQRQLMPGTQTAMAWRGRSTMFLCFS